MESDSLHIKTMEIHEIIKKYKELKCHVRPDLSKMFEEALMVFIHELEILAVVKDKFGDVVRLTGYQTINDIQQIDLKSK